MKKKLLPLIFLLSLPLVYAAGSAEQGFVWFVSLILGKVGTFNAALTKLALFAILFAAMVKGFKRIFGEHNSGAFLLALLVALVGIRFMPVEWLGGLGKFIWVAALIIIPYMIVNLVVQDWSLIKIGLLLVAYFGVYLIVVGTGFWAFGSFTNFYTDFFYFYSVYRFQTMVVILLIIGYFALRWGRGKGRKRF